MLLGGDDSSSTASPEEPAVPPAQGVESKFSINVNCAVGKK